MDYWWIVEYIFGPILSPYLGRFSDTFSDPFRVHFWWWKMSVLTDFLPVTLCPPDVRREMSHRHIVGRRQQRVTTPCLLTSRLRCVHHVDRRTFYVLWTALQGVFRSCSWRTAAVQRCPSRRRPGYTLHTAISGMGPQNTGVNWLQ